VSGTTLPAATEVFEVDREGETVIMTPRGPWPNLDWQEGQTWAGEAALGVLEARAKNVVVDLRGAEGFGPAALGLFLRLWKGVRDREGRMVLCNASRGTTGLLRATSLDCVWPLCPTREAALAAVASGRLASTRP
jgi:anti-anti-sigma factor